MSLCLMSYKLVVSSCIMTYRKFLLIQYPLTPSQASWTTTCLSKWQCPFIILYKLQQTTNPQHGWKTVLVALETHSVIAMCLISLVFKLVRPLMLNSWVSLYFKCFLRVAQPTRFKYINKFQTHFVAGGLRPQTPCNSRPPASLIHGCTLKIQYNSMD